MSREGLSEEERRAVFAALVEAQDAGRNAQDSRVRTCRRFGLTDHQLRRIEQEGIEKEWPPLS